MSITRREFIKISTLGLAAYGIGKSLVLSTEAAPPKVLSGVLPKRALGKTGHQVGVFSLGGQGTLEQDGTLEESVAIINRALDSGVNYLDTAPYYAPSQDYLGEVMKTRRKEVFLATKTHDRTRDGSLRLLEDSLKRLHTDRIDLWQLHNIRTQQDLDKIFGKNGAIQALEKAKSQKIVRFLGITGHYDPFVLAEGIKRYPFDCILMALNAADKHLLSFIENLLPSAVQRNMGIIGMKVPARGSIFRKDGISNMKQAMDYVLTLPVSTIIVGCDTVKQLEENVKIAQEFKPLSETEMKKYENLTRTYAQQASWFKKQV